MFKLGDVIYFDDCPPDVCYKVIKPIKVIGYNEVYYKYLCLFYKAVVKADGGKWQLICTKHINETALLKGRIGNKL